MKKLSFIAIPVFVVLLILAGVFVWKMVKPSSTEVNTQTGSLPNSLGSASGNKPSNPFSLLFGSQTAGPIPTPTPASVAAMNTDLHTIGDDGGAADISVLQASASGL